MYIIESSKLGFVHLFLTLHCGETMLQNVTASKHNQEYFLSTCIHACEDVIKTLTAAVFRVTEPELQTCSSRMLLAAVRWIHEQPELLLQRI